jgi:predicted phosphodiesterase
MRMAIVSDVHANQVGLSAVLKDIKVKCPGVLTVDLGDLLDGGPKPNEVLDLALENIKIFIQGNHENYQQKCSLNAHWEHHDHELWKLVPFGVKLLGDRLSSFLELQKFQSSIIPGITFLHASLKSNSKMPSFFVEQGSHAFNVPQTIQLEAKHFYFVGHSHYPGVHWDLEGNAWINTGSVGYPFLSKSPTLARSTWVELELLSEGFTDSNLGLNAANQGVLKLKVSFHEVPYDHEQLVADWVESRGLELGGPYAWAILSQSLFNEDIVYAIFKSGKGKSRSEFESHFKQVIHQKRLKERIREAISSSPLRSKLDRL